MRIETARFGILQLSRDAVIHFPWGIPGFENLKKYVLLDHREGPFKWLQSVDDPQVAFIVSPPEVVGVTYQIPESQLRHLQLEDREDLVVLVMISFDRRKNIPRPHFTGPLLFNAKNRQALQWSIDPRELPKYQRLCTSNA
ncbi:flagellar assembly protein FliW [Desulfoferrobacter suflitae]|uniref:flagellar assembly protein FliW n=1 Tax=Desulfoferrobacter suflitae TaxID=2865782 RepID=UPI0021644818|nr:flagellar assembly protein FliW [Desulfoferrobacter suflitae]MCK8602384.1 flagellar assembly protein FliW [Desulfoferrobacter suflitae]